MNNSLLVAAVAGAAGYLFGRQSIPAKPSKACSKQDALCAKKGEGPFTLTYFAVMAKGLGPALVAAFSGLDWRGNRDTGFTGAQWAEMKKSGVTIFGQLPLLKTAEGLRVNQTTAILQYIGRKAGMQGATMEDYAMSLMLMAEGEDIYSVLQKYVPTQFVGLGEGAKGDRAAYDAFWEKSLAPHLTNLENLLAAHSGSFTSSNYTVGELYLWSMLHQACLVRGLELFESTPALGKWYAALLQHDTVRQVLSGDSPFGPIAPYYLSPDQFVEFKAAQKQ
mmetsp:Transcript_8570/g.9724  ORF Transcript_8570/g.9724 Transcript_8570/m.9724 type:complete len:278 (+) Transcript_8570:25-858(+)|eukprot:CAMPEP_0205825532 /NCGR_PEP_ID=MMETSP0206-20130828/25523_1 /ASSEMBLY_ACC=CAM_ASM_000279 /TAXON_ID=36767 /ORGANISM="Euplotes focardii, Strain TN1" /LENGTH=277 /DNA_ID=CAMNT_0053124637 /DNA_START=24 /DNA_END=857 /DNA_ORIENTATION=+